MLHTYDYCCERADEAQAHAEAATLENVRSRELRSERTWRGLAELARSAAEGRAKADRRREKAAEAARDAAGESGDGPL